YRLIRHTWPAAPPAPGPNERRRKGGGTTLKAAWGVGALAAFTLVVAFTPVLVGWTRREPSGAVGLTGRYYANNETRGEAWRTRVDESIDFDWSTDPPLLPPFSVEWTGVLQITTPGVYRFRVET